MKSKGKNKSKKSDISHGRKPDRMNVRKSDRRKSKGSGTVPPKKPDKISKTNDEVITLFEEMKKEVIMPLINVFTKIHSLMKEIIKIENDKQNISFQKIFKSKSEIKDLKNELQQQFISNYLNCIIYEDELKLFYSRFFKLFLKHFNLSYNTMSDYNKLSGQYAEFMKFEDYNQKKNTGPKSIIRLKEYADMIRYYLEKKLWGGIPKFESILKDNMWFVKIKNGQFILNINAYRTMNTSIKQFIKMMQIIINKLEKKFM